MVDIAVILGANRSRAENELKESLEFEIKLANVSIKNFFRNKRSNIFFFISKVLEKLLFMFCTNKVKRHTQIISFFVYSIICMVFIVFFKISLVFNMLCNSWRKSVENIVRPCCLG